MYVKVQEAKMKALQEQWEDALNASMMGEVYDEDACSYDNGCVTQ